MVQLDSFVSQNVVKPLHLTHSPIPPILYAIFVYIFIVRSFCVQNKWHFCIVMVYNWEEEVTLWQIEHVSICGCRKSWLRKLTPIRRKTDFQLGQPQLLSCYAKHLGKFKCSRSRLVRWITAAQKISAVGLYCKKV